MKVTIKDVAKRAGVSNASVSLVLNGRPNRIAAETRQRILSTAHELGYKVLEKKVVKESTTSKMIGVIHPDLNYYFANQCVEGIQGYANVCGYKIILYHIGNSTEKCLDAIEVLTELRMDGFIIIPPLDANVAGHNIKIGEALKRSKTQFLFLDRAVDRIFCDFITSDNKQGAYMATEHMVLCGHQEIGFIAGMHEVYNTRKRIEGYKEALVFYNISLCEENIYMGDYQMESGYKAAEQFWNQGIRAIVACSDEMAVGVYKFAIEKGLIIGEDLSIVGFDNSEICSLLQPSLTSVNQSGTLMGKRACELIVQRIAKMETEAVRDTFFAPTLVERNSVKILTI